MGLGNLTRWSHPTWHLFHGMAEQISEEYFDKNNIRYKEITSVSGNILTKLITLTYLFDYSSIYRAILSEVDPTPVSSINFIKDRI